MRVSIWDMDYYHKITFLPNHKAMKISSYHKQLGDKINFILKEDDLNFKYDIMYIIRERGITPFPPSKYIDKNDVRLIGKDFKYYGRFFLTPEMEMCRPDYALYPLQENSAYANAHVVQFLHGTQLLPVKQNFKNLAKGRKKTLVVDELFWKTDKDTIMKMFNELKSLKNIAFLYPISLKRLLTDNDIKNSFLELKFSTGTYFKFKNDYGSDFESVKNIVDFFRDEFKKIFPNVGLQGFPVKSILNDHWSDRESGSDDLERCLKCIDYGKQNKIKVIIKKPKYRFKTPFWVFFESLETWTKYAFHLSYIDLMVRGITNRTGLKWYEIINNPVHWATARTYFLIHLLFKYPKLIEKYGVRRLGDEVLDFNLIDFNKVLKGYSYYFEYDEIIKGIQELREDDELEDIIY